MDATAAERLGVTFEPRHLIRTNVLEEAFEKVAELLKDSFVEVIALDSIAALLPEKGHRYSRGDIPSRKSQNHQHRIEYFLKILLGPLFQSRAVLLVTNQIREKVGVMFGNPEMPPWETTPLRDYASVRVDLRRTGTVKERDEAIGIELRAKVIKNRLGPTLRQAEFELVFATGIARESELLSLGLQTGLLTKLSAYIYLGDTRLGHGSANVIQLLRQDADLAAQIRAGIIERSRPEIEPVAGEGGT
jgi:recombination protein RecA